MKNCSGCKRVLDIECFGVSRATKDGLQTYCKVCKKEHQRLWNKKNKDKRNAYSKNWRDKAPDVYKLSQKKYRETHREKILAKNSRRVAEQLKRTPSWADLEAIERFYMECPPGLVVDHIVPKKGRNVSGLHVLENLQYLTPEENLSKGNRWP